MEDLTFKGLPEGVHHCTSRQDGDWIVWICPHCPGFERRFNWVTEEMCVKNKPKGILHTGASTQQQNMGALAVPGGNDN